MILLHIVCSITVAVFFWWKWICADAALRDLRAEFAAYITESDARAARRHLADIYE